MELPDRSGRGYNNQHMVKKPKIEIVINRSDDFFQRMEEFEKIREDAIKREEQELAQKESHAHAASHPVQG